MPPLSLDAWDLSPDEVERRLAWARRQGRPGFPWPGVEVAAWRACLVELARVVRAVLRPDGDEAPALRTPAGVGPEALGVAAYTSGLGPLLGLWIERGSLAADAADAELLALHLEHGRRRARALRAMLGEALDALSDAGVPVTVLKGAHTSVAYFPEPGARPAADVDLLVPPGTLEGAGRALAAAGWAPGARQSRPGKADWIPTGTSTLPRSLHLVHADDPRRVELHDSLARDFFGVRTVELDAAGALEPHPDVHPLVRVLAPPLLVAHLALHASQELHHVQMLRLLELAWVVEAERVAGRLDDGAVASVLARAGALRFALPALDLAEKLVPGSMEPALLDLARRDAPRRMTRYLERLLPATAQRLEGISLDERFIWCRGVRETGRRALSLLVPRRASGSARPPVRTVSDRLLGLTRGRVRVRTSPALRDEATP